MDNKYIIAAIVVLFLFVMYNRKYEKMSNTDAELEGKIKVLINKIYRADVDSIRNLSEVSKTLQAGKLEIPGDLTVKGKFNYLPKGTIVAFNGTKAPAGWALCDGKNGTPDLRGRFIYGYGSGSGNTINRRGGSETHKLNSNEIPSHSHYNNFKVNTDKSGNHRHSMSRPKGDQTWSNGRKKAWWGSSNNGSHNTNYGGNHFHKVSVKGYSNATGGGRAHNNMPPYHVLSYIMKL